MLSILSRTCRYSVIGRLVANDSTTQEKHLITLKNYPRSYTLKSPSLPSYANSLATILPRILLAKDEESKEKEKEEDEEAMERKENPPKG